MSNFRAVAHVLAAVKHRLESEFPIGDVVTSAVVDVDSPATAWSGPPTVRLCAYQVVPNGALRGQDLPTRNGSGQVLQRPAAALDLHFLVSFFGSRSTLEPERLCGFVSSVLHAYPVLGANTLEAVATGDLADSDLADQTDRVTLSPVAMTLEEMTRLWGTLTTNPYVLSYAWQASCILLHRPVSQRRALPVRTPAVTVAPMGGPFLTAVDNYETGEPITSTSVVYLSGKGLRGETTRIQIGTTVFSLDSERDLVRSTYIHADLAEMTLTAGIHPIRVVHPVFRSNALPLVVHPVISWGEGTDPVWDPPDVGSPVGSGLVVIHVTPALGSNQRARLHLSRYVDGVQENYSLEEDPLVRSGGTVLSFPVAQQVPPPSPYLYDLLVAGGSPSNRWILRVEVDGVFSVPIYDAGEGAYNAPWVEM